MKASKTGQTLVAGLSGFSKSLTFRFALVLSSLLVLVITAYIVLTSATKQKAYDSKILNLAGRQRTWVERYTRETNLALIALSVSDWKTLLEQRQAAIATAEEFTETHRALLEGGEVSLRGEKLRLPRVQPEIRKQLEAVGENWEELKRGALRSLLSEKMEIRGNRNIAVIQTDSHRLVELMDDVVYLFQVESDRKLESLLFYQKLLSFAGALVFLGMIFFVRRQIEIPLNKSMSQLAISEEQHRALYDSAVVGLWQASISDLVFLRCNESTAHILGYESAAELLAARSAFATLVERNPRFLVTLQGQSQLDSVELVTESARGRVILEISARFFPAADLIEGAMIDITARKQAEVELALARRRLVEVAHRAGQAETAASVLHNVGNVLNSVGTSASFARRKILESRIPFLSKALVQLKKHCAESSVVPLPAAAKTIEYMDELTQELLREHSYVTDELDSLVSGVQHIDQVIRYQQGVGRTSSIIEEVNLAELIDHAVSISGLDEPNCGIQLLREIENVEVAQIDRHKLIQVLLNLFLNAKYAVLAGPSEQACVRVALAVVEGSSPAKARITVFDNGMGISKANLSRIFTAGFTTKADGNGLGLHSSAIAVAQLGGALEVQSDGEGKGAAFSIVVPLQPAKT